MIPYHLSHVVMHGPDLDSESMYLTSQLTGESVAVDVGSTLVADSDGQAALRDQAGHMKNILELFEYKLMKGSPVSVADGAQLVPLDTFLKMHVKSVIEFKHNSSRASLPFRTWKTGYFQHMLTFEDREWGELALFFVGCEDSCSAACIEKAMEKVYPRFWIGP